MFSPGARPVAGGERSTSGFTNRPQTHKVTAMSDIPDPANGRTAAAVRRAAAVRAAIALVVAAVLLWWKPWLAAVAAAVAVLTLLLGLLSPLGAYAALERALERFAHAVGRLVTWILLPPLYYLLFAPAGLLLRRHLRLTRRPDPEQTTYWRRPESRGERWQGDGLDRYRRQF